jgi:hypothetical protein
MLGIKYRNRRRKKAKRKESDTEYPQPSIRFVG